MTKTISPAMLEAYKDALFCQDACNLSGVLYSFSRHMKTLCDEIPDTKSRNTHPVAKLFASKIASLTACDEMFEMNYDHIADTLIE